MRYAHLELDFLKEATNKVSEVFGENAYALNSYALKLLQDGGIFVRDNLR